MNKKNLVPIITIIILIVVGVVGIVVVVGGTGRFHVNSSMEASGLSQAFQKSFACTDSDGGLDYYMFGKVTQTHRNRIDTQIYPDKCIGDKNLIEYYCQENKVRSKKYVCPNGCNNGACASSVLSEYNCEKFLYNGNPERKINLFFISDGFNNSNIDVFKKNVEWASDLSGESNGLFSKTPYRNNKNLFNIYTISSEKIFDCLLTHNSGPNALPCDIDKILDIPKESCGISKIDYVILVGHPYSPVSTNEKRSGIWNANKFSVLLGDIVDPSWIQASMNHEVGGHGIGGLGDEYYSSDEYKESWNIWPNIDKPGCPKWCSGEINTNAPCYQTYLEWKDCVQPYLDQTCSNGDYQYSCGKSENIKTCHDKLYQKEIDAGRFLPNCNIGLSCISEAGCYWGGGYSLANFRSTKDGIMYAAYLDGTYVPVGKKEIEKKLKELISSLFIK